MPRNADIACSGNDVRQLLPNGRLSLLTLINCAVECIQPADQEHPTFVQRGLAWLRS